MTLRTLFFKNKEEDVDRESIRRIRNRSMLYILIVSFFVFAIGLYSITISSTNITPAQVYQTLWNQILPGSYDIPYKTGEIIMKVYTPRVLYAAIVGSILAIGGCLIQTILKNPLATPYTLGVSSSAAFGAGMAILMGISAAAGTLGIILNSFLFSLIPAAIIIISSIRRSMMPTTLILIGISISYLFGAANTIMQYFGEGEAVKAVVFWTVGDLNNAILSNVPILFFTLLFTVIASFCLVHNLELLRMGDDTATSLGIDVKSTRLLAVLLACFSTSVAICFTGAIGFICLLAPHVSRIIIGGNLKFLIPASAALGALLLLIADIIAKDLINPIMLPVGAITALIGAPILIFLLLRKKNMVIN